MATFVSGQWVRTEDGRVFQAAEGAMNSPHEHWVPRPGEFVLCTHGQYDGMQYEIRAAQVHEPLWDGPTRLIYTTTNVACSLASVVPVLRSDGKPHARVASAAPKPHEILVPIQGQPGLFRYVDDKTGETTRMVDVRRGGRVAILDLSERGRLAPAPDLAPEPAAAAPTPPSGRCLRCGGPAYVGLLEVECLAEACEPPKLPEPDPRTLEGIWRSPEREWVDERPYHRPMTMTDAPQPYHGYERAYRFKGVHGWSPSYAHAIEAWRAKLATGPRTVTLPARERELDVAKRIGERLSECARLVDAGLLPKKSLNEIADELRRERDYYPRVEHLR